MTADLFWGDEQPKPEWIINAPFPGVQIGFSAEKASVTIVGKNYRLHAEGLNTDEPRMGYLQIRRANPVDRWQRSPRLSATIFARPNGDRVRLVWQQAATVILQVSDHNDVFLHFELAAIRLDGDAIELEAQKQFSDFQAAYKAATGTPWLTEKEGDL